MCFFTVKVRYSSFHLGHLVGGFQTINAFIRTMKTSLSLPSDLGGEGGNRVLMLHKVLDV